MAGSNGKLFISMYHYTRDLKHSRYPEIKGLDADLFRNQISSDLFEKYVGVTEKQLAYELYMTQEQIRTLKRHWMFIGVHGYEFYWRMQEMIRFAKDSDIPAIMSFIDKYWRKNHIMSRDRELFEFQHKWGDEVSFVLSEKDGVIIGVLGYIPYNKKDRDITLAIWKTNKTEDTMQGISILSFLRENGDIHKVSAPGINPKTIPIYKFLGIGTGKMKQWYRLRGMTEFKIAKVVDDIIPECDATEGVICEEMDSFAKAQFEFRIQDCLSRDRQLTKSLDFVERRYFNHPSFAYLKYGLKSNGKKLFVVLRIQECNNSALLRVIDCIGDHELFVHFTPELDRLLEEYGCEYADCYESGIKDEVFFKGGWKMVAESGNIMPDYFAPFEQRNIDIYYMSEIENVILFKGDGDMDRPS